MPNLTDTVALVTGASSGIGRGIAIGLADAGAAVAVNYPPGEADHATEVVDEIESNEDIAVAVEADVSDPEAVESMVETIEDRFGPVTLLVNNAGIISQSPLVEMSIDQWDDLMAVNLRGVFIVTKCVLPGMLEGGEGKIINVASQLGFLGAPQLVHYSASKGGVISLTRALARELAPTVQVNGIAPGAIETNLGDSLDDDASRPLSEIPLGRYGTVADVVPTAVFLASSDSEFYTGQILSPDGGDAMH